LEKNPFPLGQNMAAFQGAIYSIFIAAICCGEIPQNYHIFAWFDQFDASKNRYHFTIPYQQKTLALHGLTMIPYKKKHVRIQGGDLNQSNLQQISPWFLKVIPSPSPCWATVFSNCPGGVGMVARRCNALPKGLPGATGEDPGALAFGLGCLVVFFGCFTEKKKKDRWLVGLLI